MGILNNIFGKKKQKRTVEKQEKLIDVKQKEEVNDTTFSKTNELKSTIEINAKPIDFKISITSTVTSTEISTEYTPMAFKFHGDDISITEFNKQILGINKQYGFDSANANYNEFWNTNKNLLDINDAHRVVNNYIGVLLFEKQQREQIKEFIDNSLQDFVGFDGLNFCMQRAKMYNKINIDLALDFLKKFTQIVEKKVSKINAQEFIEVVYYQSELLIKKKKYDEAFHNLQRTSHPLILTNHFLYSYLSSQICWLEATICEKQNPPNYTSYLYFSFCAFLYELLKDISSFPNIGEFERRRIEHRETYIPFDYEGFDELLNELNMLNCKNEMLKELFDYGYDKLPELYGIPPDYNMEEVFARNWDDEKSIIYYNEFANKLPVKFIGDLAAQMCTFVSSMTKKYYDMQNSKP